jgi:hypothetical protein
MEIISPEVLLPRKSIENITDDKSLMVSNLIVIHG